MSYRSSTEGGEMFLGNYWYAGKPSRWAQIKLKPARPVYGGLRWLGFGVLFVSGLVFFGAFANPFGTQASPDAEFWVKNGVLLWMMGCIGCFLAVKMGWPRVKHGAYEDFSDRLFAVNGPDGKLIFIPQVRAAAESKAKAQVDEFLIGIRHHRFAHDGDWRLLTPGYEVKLKEFREQVRAVGELCGCKAELTSHFDYQIEELRKRANEDTWSVIGADS